jgi:hypothetical protein
MRGFPLLPVYYIAGLLAVAARPFSPVPYRTTAAEPTFQSLTDRACACIPGNRPFPTALDPFARPTTSGSAISDFAVATLLTTSVQSRKGFAGRCRIAATHPICRNMSSSAPIQRFRIDTKNAKSRFSSATGMRRCLQLTCGLNCCTVKTHDKFP